ncbi:22010_t:CDS:2, partial [Dentiscutata erythropus]
MHTKLTRFFEVCRNNPEAAELLYSKFPKFFYWKKEAWHQDFVYAAQQLGQNATSEDPLIINCALLEIEDHIKQYGKSLEDFPELPAIYYDLLDCNRQTQLFIEETTFPQNKLQQILEDVSLLNDEQ